MRHLMLFCSALTLLTSAALATEATTTAPAPVAAPALVAPSVAATAPVAPPLTSAPVAAAPAAVPVLTEESLRAFYNESKSVHKKPLEEYKTYMNLHTHDDVQIRLNVTSHLPGKETQKQTLTLDKRKFLATLDENYKSSQGAKINHRVTGVYVGKDGKSAQVTDTTTLSNSMPFPGREQQAVIEIQSQSNCEDIVHMSPAGVMQIYESVCNTDTYLFPKQK